METKAGPLRFGVFEVDPSAGELRKQGLRLKLQDKAFQLLLALIERPGEVVSREALRQRLWPDDVFVEFDNNLNNTVSRLREALNDSAEAPRYIETVPRRGYRFIAPVDAPGAHAADEVGSPPALPPAAARRVVRRPTGRWLRHAGAGMLAASAIAAIGFLLSARQGDTAASIDSLAVLPFVAAEARDDYLAFGVTEALVTELSKVPALRVISQTSASQYMGRPKALPQIARELDVAAVVEGAVVREGDTVRITVQLIDASTDTHLWASSYTRDARNLLLMQEEIATAAAREVRLRVAGADRSATAVASAPARSVDPRVQESYLRGRFYLGLGTESGRASALTFFQQALAIDPDHAPSHAGLANYYTVTDALPAAEAMPKARGHARRALELDETLADAHASLAFVHYYADWDWQAADAQFRRALDLAPGNPRTRSWYAMYSSTMGRHEEAMEQAERALAIDPLSVMAHDTVGLVATHARRPGRVLEAGRRILALSPDSPVGYEHLAVASLLTGDYPVAADAIDRGLAVSGRDPIFLTLQAHLHAGRGRGGPARETLDELSARAQTGFVAPTFLAIAWLAVLDRDIALDWLEKALAMRDPYLVLLDVSPWFDQLRDRPRFQALLDRMRFPRRPAGPPK